MTNSEGKNEGKNVRTEEIKQNLKNKSMWLRVLFMVLFAIFYGIAISIFWAVVVFQVLYGLITGTANGRVVDFSRNLTAYLYDILRYLTMQFEEKPFPFNEWPNQKTSGSSSGSGSVPEATQ